MVQIPTYEARVGLDAPAYPTPRVDDSVGQALQSVGGAISSLAGNIQARDKQKADFDARVGYETLQAQLDQGLAEVSRGAPADGTGLHDSFMQKVYRPKATAYLASIKDPEIRGRMQAQIDQLGNEVWGSRAADAEYKLGNAYSLTQVQSMQESRLRGIAQDPTTITSYTQEVDKLVDTAPNLTAAQREELKTKFREAAPGIVAEALATTDRETLKFALGNGTNDERVAFLGKRLVPALEAAGVRPVSKDGGAQIATLVGKYLGDAEAALVAYTAGPEAADKWLKAGRDYDEVPNGKDVAPGVRKVLANLGTATLASGRPGNAAPKADALQSIRQFESFRSTAYWDVNAWRTGFGSDTVTRADGTIERVTKDTVVTREDAERDLARRTKEFQKTVIGQIGADTWAKLPDGAKAALTSMAYNYGEIPDSVAAAARTGDAGSIAAAIRARGGDNGGVNRGRREKEAQIALGGGVAGSAGGDEGYVSAVFADMPVAELQRYRASVSTQDALEKERIKQQLDLLKVDVSRAMDDDVASIRQTGQGAVAPTDTATLEKNIAEAYGLDRVAKYRDDRFVAQSIHEIIADAATTPDVVLDARLKAIEAQPGAGAGLRQQVASGAKSDIEAIKAERKVDPVGYVMRNNPDVQKAWQAFDPSKPDTAADALSVTIEAQKSIGIPPDKVMPLPADKAQAVAALVKNPDLPVDQRAATLISTIMLTPNVEQQRQIIAQMVKAGLPPMVSNVVEAYSRGDVGATMRLFQAAMIDPEKAPKLGANDNMLAATVEDKMLGAGTIGRTFYGFDIGDPRSAEIAASDLELAKTATRLAMAGGMSLDAASEQAVADIFGSVENLDADLPSGARVSGLADKGVDTEALSRGLDKANGKLMDAISGYIARAYGTAPTGMTPEQKAVFRASRTETATRIFANGVWRNNGDGWSFFDTEHRAFVADAEGKPIVFATDELLKLGGAEPAPTTVPALPPGAFNPAVTTPANPEQLKDYLRKISPAAAPKPTPQSRKGRGPAPMPPAPGTTLQDRLKADQSQLMDNGPLRDPTLRSNVMSKSPGG